MPAHKSCFHKWAYRVKTWRKEAAADFRRSAATCGGGARAGGGARDVLFDEPFGALDPVTRHEMQQQLLALTNVTTWRWFL